VRECGIVFLGITAGKWEVSLMWVQRLCKKNGIEGALDINCVWLIPQGAVKPDDAQKKKKFQKTCKIF